MASEIQFHQTAYSGKTLYATLRNEPGWFYDVAHESWDETPTTAEISNYVIGLMEVSTLGFFVGNLPDGLDPVAVYFVTIHRRIGGSAAATDPVVGSGQLGRVPIRTDRKLAHWRPGP